MDAIDTDRQNIASLVLTVKATFGTSPSPRIQATWLGHAAFLIETPAQEGAERGVRILLDPAFSERCSPFQNFGGFVRMNGQLTLNIQGHEIEASLAQRRRVFLNNYQRSMSS